MPHSSGNGCGDSCDVIEHVFSNVSDRIIATAFFYVSFAKSFGPKGEYSIRKLSKGRRILVVVSTHVSAKLSHVYSATGE